VLKRLVNQTPLYATTADRLISAVTVTDPRHPLYGQRLAVLSLACSRGPRFIAVALPDGRRRLIQCGATRGVSPNPRKFCREPEASTLGSYGHGFMVSDFP